MRKLRAPHPSGVILRRINIWPETPGVRSYVVEEPGVIDGQTYAKGALVHIREEEELGAVRFDSTGRPPKHG